MMQVNAARNVFLDFPTGHNFGKPNEEELQTRILKDTLRVLETASSPGEVVDLPYEWGESFNFESIFKNMSEMCEEEGSIPQEWKPKPENIIC
ncbi:hypothetical protein ACFL9T_06925 [Thermodesulfobacteriota bacterium]